MNCEGAEFSDGEVRHLATRKWICSPGLRLPPFGKHLADAFMSGVQPKAGLVFVYFDAWPLRPARIVHAVVCPPEANPEDFDWRILAGLDVFVVVPHECHEGRLRRLLNELILCQLRRLILLRDRPPFSEFIISSGRGLEVQP